MRPTASKCDVVICGCGPAGAAAAIALARRGKAVSLLGRIRPARACCREMLSPAIKPLLIELRVECPATHAMPVPGILSAWGVQTLTRNDFIFNPYGAGWNVDRYQFDQALLAAARDAGVTFHSASIIHCRRQRDEWIVHARGSAGEIEICGRVMVKAMGRCPLAGAPRARVRRHDRLIGVVGYRRHPGIPADPRLDSHLLIEATQTGWWYSIPAPDGCMAVHMTDADLIPHQHDELRHEWMRRLAMTDHTAGRFSRKDQNNPTTRLCITAADTFVRLDSTHDTYLCVGDSAGTVDPLSGQGVLQALHSGQDAAEAVCARLEGHRKALADHTAHILNAFDSIVARQKEYYSIEQRWPDSPFWKRRV